MFSRPLALVLLTLACLTAAAGGAYVATRHNLADQPSAAVPSPATAPAADTARTTPSAPVAETEVTKDAKDSKDTKASAEPAAAPAVTLAKAVKEPVKTAARETPPRRERAIAHDAASRTAPAALPAAAPQADAQTSETAAPPPPPADAMKPVDPPPPPADPPAPQFDELILPSAAVIGLQLDSGLSSERARVEDRVDAHVTRDVLVAGRVAIPVGSRVIGSVTAVDRGGKMKQAARLAIKFHTLVLADGSEVMLQTEPIERFGESPSANSTRKIGGAAVAGSILGAILGGGKGAAIGGATGAAAGGAAVMAGDRAQVTLAPGSLVNAKLAAPATITVERRN